MWGAKRSRVGPAPDPSAAATESETAATARSGTESIQLRQVRHTVGDEARHAAVDDDETKKSVVEGEEEEEEEGEEADKLHREAKRRFLRQAVIKELQDFANYTHICGFERIFNAKFFILRLLWLCIFVVAIGLTFYQLHQLVRRYTAVEGVSTSTPAVYSPTFFCPMLTKFGSSMDH